MLVNIQFLLLSKDICKKDSLFDQNVRTGMHVKKVAPVQRLTAKKRLKSHAARLKPVSLPLIGGI